MTDRPEYMVQTSISPSGGGMVVELFTGNAKVGEAYLRNKFSAVTGMRFYTARNYDVEDEQDRRDMTTIEVSNTRKEITNGYMKIDTQMFEALCRSFLELRGYTVPNKPKHPEYVQANGLRCPHCNSGAVGAPDMGTYEGRDLLRKTYCSDCGTTWTEVYTLMDIENLEVGDE